MVGEYSFNIAEEFRDVHFNDKRLDKRFILDPSRNTSCMQCPIKGAVLRFFVPLLLKGELHKGDHETFTQIMGRRH